MALKEEETPTQIEQANAPAQGFVEEKLDSVEEEVVAAITTVGVSILSDKQAAAENFPLFSRDALRLFLVCSPGFFATICYGFDGTVLSGVNVMPQYLSYFGQQALGGSTGLIFSLFYAGAFVSVLTGPILCDRFGRRAPIFVGGIIALIGAIVQVTSMNIAQFRASRFLLGIGSRLCFSFGPLYTVEMAHPYWRGRMGGLLMGCLVFGTIFAGWINFGASYSTSDFAWRFPLAIQAIPPLFCIIVPIFCPETPRYLFMCGKKEEALRVLTKFHGRGNPNSQIVKLQYSEYSHVIVEGQNRRWFWHLDYRELFSNRANIYRSFILCDYETIVQWSGNSLAIYYVPVLLLQSGVKNYHISLLITAIITVVAFFFTLFGIWLMDVWGRRTTLMLAMLTMSSCMAVLAGLQSPGKAMNQSETNASIAFIILLRLTYTVFLTPTEALYTYECLPQSKRELFQNVS